MPAAPHLAILTCLDPRPDPLTYTDSPGEIPIYGCVHGVKTGELKAVPEATAAGVAPG